MADRKPAFSPMPLARTAFAPAARGKGSPAERDLVVPIRSESVRVPVRPLTGDGAPPVPRAFFPREDPPPAPAPTGPPPGPSADEIAQMVQEAERRGHARGRAELLPELQRRSEAEARLTAVVDAVDAARHAWAEAARTEGTDLTLAAVRHLVGNVPELLDLLVRERLSAALERLVGSRRVVVRVNPRDVPAVLGVLGEREGWEVIPDPGVTGGCIASSEAGELDGSLEACIAALDSAVSAWRAETGVP
jgi:hypothetical protein